jgi:hypothetical protein
MSKTKRTPPPSPPARPAAPPALPPIDLDALADRYALPIMVGLLMVGFTLRLLNLDALTLWVDEFVHVLRARDVTNGSGPLFTNDNNGILLTVSQLPFAKVFGATAFWMRLPSVLFGVGSIWLMYRLGEGLFHRYVGVLAAWMGTVSLYLIFWSRISRNYAIFSFFVLLAGCFFLKAMEARRDTSSSHFFQKNGLPLRYAGAALAALVGALLSHSLAFFFGFTVGVYCLGMALGRIRRGTDDRFRNKYFVLGMALLPLMLLALPGVNGLVRGPLLALLSPEQVDWVLPQASRLAELWDKYPWGAWDIYHGVLRYDPRWLYPAALGGIGVAFWLRRRSGMWLVAAWVVPFLLMVFLFREPALPRYLIFAFPYFLLSAAAFFYGSYVFIFEKKYPTASNSMRYAGLLLPFLIVLCNARWTEIKSLVLAERLAGHVVDSNISQFNFTNWREPAEYIRQHQQPGDVVMSTITTAASYYLDRDDVLWFRQNQYDTRQKKYVPLAAEPNRPSAATLQDLQRTVASSPRGWLLANYYLDNVFVDTRARMFVYQNMHFYPDASSDGSVMLFGWDNARPKPQNQTLVVQLGKAEEKIASADFYMTIPPELLSGATLPLFARYSGVNSGKEALIVFNDNNAVYLPPNRGKGIENQQVTVQSAWLRPGQNKLQILYEEAVKTDPDKGFTVYNLAF